MIEKKMKKNEKNCNLFHITPIQYRVKTATALILDKDLLLIDRILRGETPAYRELVTRHKDYAFTISFRILNNREEAEEAAQDAFVRAFNGLQNFNREAKFTTWFYRVVMNAALTIQQKKKIATEDIDNVHTNSTLLRGSDSTDNMKRQEQRYYIKAALKQLSSDDVTMITLFYLKEQSLEEIADIVGIETNTVKVKLHRARKRLADVMQEMLKDETQSLL
jgi:RNA polymerase sigma factor (sigma-70 family)